MKFPPTRSFRPRFRSVSFGVLLVMLVFSVGPTALTFFSPTLKGNAVTASPAAGPPQAPVNPVTSGDPLINFTETGLPLNTQWTVCIWQGATPPTSCGPPPVGDTLMSSSGIAGTILPFFRGLATGAVWNYLVPTVGSCAATSFSVASPITIAAGGNTVQVNFTCGVVTTPPSCPAYSITGISASPASGAGGPPPLTVTFTAQGTFPTPPPTFDWTVAQVSSNGQLTTVSQPTTVGPVMTQSFASAGSYQVSVQFSPASVSGNCTPWSISYTVVSATPPSVTLTVTKTATPTVEVGGAISVTVVVTNTGNTPETISVTDTPGETLTCTPVANGGSLPPGASTTCTGTYMAPSTPGMVTDTVVAKGTDSAGMTGVATATATTNVIKPEATVVKIATTTVQTGGTIMVTAIVTNTGSSPETVSVVDSAGETLTCSPTPQGGTLAPGASTTCTGSYTAPSTAGTVTDTVTATVMDTTGAKATATSTATTTVTSPTTTSPPKSCQWWNVTCWKFDLCALLGILWAILLAVWIVVVAAGAADWIAGQLTSLLSAILSGAAITAGQVNGVLGGIVGAASAGYMAFCGPCDWAVFTIVGIILAAIIIIILYIYGEDLPDIWAAVIAAAVFLIVAIGILLSGTCKGYSCCSKEDLYTVLMGLIAQR